MLQGTKWQSPAAATPGVPGKLHDFRGCCGWGTPALKAEVFRPARAEHVMNSEDGHLKSLNGGCFSLLRGQAKDRRGIKHSKL